MALTWLRWSDAVDVAGSDEVAMVGCGGCSWL